MEQKLMGYVPQGFAERAETFGYDFVKATIVFIAFCVVAAIARMVIVSFGKHSDAQRKSVLQLIGEIARVTVITFGLVTALSELRINVSALVAGLGLTGFALGFAFKDALSNVLAGVMILLYHPFRLGDHVEVISLQLQGEVTGIDLRYTTLRTEGKIFLVPNSILLNNAISLSQTSNNPTPT